MILSFSLGLSRCQSTVTPQTIIEAQEEKYKAVHNDLYHVKVE